MIYCNYDKIIGQNTFAFTNSAWLSPYSKEIWGLVILTFFAAFFVSQSRSGISWIHVFALFLRQSFVKYHILFFLISYSTIPMLLLYEYNIAAKLIAPLRPTQLISLKQVLDGGYEIFAIKTVPNTISLKHMLQPIFDSVGYGNKIDSIVHQTIDYRTEALVAVLGAEHPNRSILVATQDPTYFLHYVKNDVLRGRYDCYKIENIALVRSYFDIFYLRLQKEVISLLSQIQGGGLTNFWKEMDNFNNFAIMKGRESKIENKEEIRMNELLPLCFVCLVVLAVSCFVFITEILCTIF